MEWSRIRSKILALHRFDVQPKLKEAGLPAGLFVLPRFALDLALKELSPNAFAVFTLLYSRLDFELRTHWVSGLSVPKIAGLLGLSKGTVRKAIKELREKQYIYVVSGRKAPNKARGIRKYIFGQAKWMGNDYNAYSLLPFFVKLYMELDAQRLEEPEDENLDLPSDEEVLKSSNLPKLPSTDVDTQGLEEPRNAGSVPDPSEKDQFSQRGDTTPLKSLGDKAQSNDLGQNLTKDTPAFKPLGDKAQSNDLGQNLTNPLVKFEPTLGQNLTPPWSRFDQQTNDTKTNETQIYDTHTNERAPAEKNPSSREDSEPAPADRLGELALKLLTAYLSRSENVKSPIAVLKSLTEAQLETLACNALSWFLNYYDQDWELRDEVDRLMEEHGLKCLELLEYVQLSEEGKVEWLKKKGVLKDGSD